jgi:alginate O-acetyltransferase complex protein AlgI
VLFNSFEFAVFLPLVVAVFFLLPQRGRKYFLLFASYYFYMCWRVDYILLILASTLVAYVSARRMAATDHHFSRRAWLVVSLVANLGLLFTFKYINLAGDAVNSVFRWIDMGEAIPWFNILLPVGISFYTFQTLSYTIDVYRKEKEVEKDFITVALYVAFFPQLVAGPIERATRLLPQFSERMAFDYARARDGLILIFWGLFKKVVIADRVAVFVDAIYNQAGTFEGIPVWVATYLFAFQIYCDFSGYSDIAIGSAAIMGYRLMTNFKQPYFSTSIGEFWSRWHISLSTWFRDYLYIPLGGNRVPSWRWQVNLMIVFLVSGLWHGANWTFIVWGGLHGFYLVCGIWLGPLWGKLSGSIRSPSLLWFLKVFCIFHLVCFAWIFFRANSLADAWLIIQSMMSIQMTQLSTLTSFGLSSIDFVIVVGAIAVLEGVHLFQRRKAIRPMLARQAWPVRWAVYYALVMAVLLFGGICQ